MCSVFKFTRIIRNVIFYINLQLDLWVNNLNKNLFCKFYSVHKLLVIRIINEKSRDMVKLLENVS